MTPKLVDLMPKQTNFSDESDSESYRRRESRLQKNRAAAIIEDEVKSLPNRVVVLAVSPRVPVQTRALRAPVLRVNQTAIVILHLLHHLHRHPGLRLHLIVLFHPKHLRLKKGKRNIESIGRPILSNSPLKRNRVILMIPILRSLSLREKRDLKTDIKSSEMSTKSDVNSSSIQTNEQKSGKDSEITAQLEYEATQALMALATSFSIQKPDERSVRVNSDLSKDKQTKSPIGSDNRICV